MSRVNLPFAQSHQEGCSQTEPHCSISQSERDKDGLGFIQHSHITHGVPQPRQLTAAGPHSHCSQGQGSGRIELAMLLKICQNP